MSEPVLEPTTDRGRATRQALLDAAEEVFGLVGYNDASIGEITRRADVAQGTFYVYFPDKRAAFSEVVRQVNRKVRHASTLGTEGAVTRMDAEKGGFRAFFDYIEAHPSIYRIVRDAEFVAPEAAGAHYEAWARPYAAALREAQESGEFADGIDPDLLAHLLMGLSEFFGQRLPRWESLGREESIDQLLLFVERALTADDPRSHTVKRVMNQGDNK